MAPLKRRASAASAAGSDVCKAAKHAAAPAEFVDADASTVCGSELACSLPSGSERPASLPSAEPTEPTGHQDPRESVALADGERAAEPTGHQDSRIVDAETVLLEAFRTNVKKEKDEEANSEDLGPRKYKLKSQLEAAVAAGSLSTASALCQRMKRGLSAAEKERYELCKTDEERRNFRMEWARRELTQLEASKEHTKSWQRVDETKGEYKTCASIAESYGYLVDPVGALRSAEKYCEKCVTMMGKWVRYDDMAETIMYLHVTKQHKELFTEAWLMCEKFSDKSKQPAIAEHEPETTPAAAATKAKGTGKGKPKAKATAKAAAARAAAQKANEDAIA